MNDESAMAYVEYAIRKRRQEEAERLAQSVLAVMRDEKKPMADGSDSAEAVAKRVLALIQR